MKISVEKRFLSLFCAFVMVLSLLPWEAVEVHAAEVKGLGVAGLHVSYDDKGTWIVKDGELIGSAEGTTSDDTCTSNSATKSTLTIRNTLGKDATLKFSYKFTDNDGSLGGAISGTSGTYEKTLPKDQSITIVVTSAEGKGKVSTLVISELSFLPESADDVTMTVKSVTGGMVTVDGNAVNANADFVNPVGKTYTLKATPDGTHDFLGWHDGTGYISYNAEFSYMPVQNITLTPVYVAKGAAIFEVNGVKYSDLNEANAAAVDASKKVIILANNGTLPAGDYTISDGNTLLIPFDDKGTCYTDKEDKCVPTEGTGEPPRPYVFRTLTMAKGATIHVEDGGAISVSAQHSDATGGKPYGGRVRGPYGLIKMESNSAIDLESGGVLYAWGYITGSGTVTANPDATIHEMMQITDYAGGTATGAMTNADRGTRIFPFSQYYVQNVEVEEIIHAGAKLVTTATVTGLSQTESSAVTFIGEGGMFTMGTDAVVTKKYDPATDRLIISASGDVSLGGLTAGAAGITIDSSLYYLPINGNISININSGTATLNQDIVMYPGAEITVDHGATVVIPTDSEVFAYDKDDWGNYVFADNSYKTHYGLTYLPKTGAASTRGVVGDVKIDLNGTLEVTGKLYTSAHNAQVISSEGTGKIILNSDAPGSTTIKAIKTVSNDKWGALLGSSNATFYDIAMNPAVLTNGNGNDTTSTAGATAGTTFIYCVTHDKWVTDPCPDCCEHIPAADDGNCETPIKCSLCGIEITAAKSHIDGDDKNHVCDNDGCTIDNVDGGHAGGDAKCNAKAKCEECGQEYGELEANDHAQAIQYHNLNTDGHKAYYPCCQNLDSAETVAHRYDEATHVCVCNDVEEFTVTFTINGEAYGQPATVEYGAAVTAPAYVTPEGHAFSGWTVPETMPAEHITLNATLTVNSYTITLMVDGAQYGETLNLQYGEIISLPAPEKQQEGCTVYTFSGWNETVPATMPAENLTFTGSFAESKEHTGKNTYTPNDDGETHMVICECGVTLDADEAHEYDEITNECICGAVEVPAVAEVNGVKYETLAEAVAAAKDGDTVILLQDTVLTEKLTVETKQTWNFGGYTVTTPDGGDNYGLVVKGDLTIESGNFSVTGIYGIGITGKLTVNGGTFTYSGDSDYMLGNWGQTIITDGTFQGQYCCVNNFSGTTEIQGGTFSTEATDCSGAYESCDLMANEGLTVIGGTFSKDVTDYCAEGFHTVKTDGSDVYTFGEHVYESAYTEPTVYKDAYTTYTCGCGHSYVVTHEGTMLQGEASIGQTKYMTLTEAVAAAKDGETVVLLRNVVLTDKLTVATTQKWEFGENTVTFCGDDNYGLVVKGDLTIESGKFVATSQYGIGVTGKLTVNGGTFSVVDGNDYLIGNWGQTVINDGAFKGQYCCVNNFSGTTEIKGGSYSTAEFDNTGEYPACDLFANEGMTVTGGTFSKDVTEYCAEGYHTQDDDLDGVYSFNKHNYEAAYNAPTFDADAFTIHSCACGDSYKETHEGTKLTAEASIGAVRYASLAEAVAAAKDGETVVLLKNVTLTEKLTVTTTQKWDFGEHTVTIAAVQDNYGLVVKGDLTIDSGNFSVTGIYGIGVTGKLTVNGGTFSVVDGNDYLIGNWGKTVINNGTFQGQYCCVNNFAGTTEIKGGSYSTAAADSADEYPPCDLFANEGLTVTGGVFSKNVTEYCDQDHHTVDPDGDGIYDYGTHTYVPTYTEPTFDADGYTTYKCICGAEYVVNGDDTQKIAVAQIGTTRFETLREAVAAAKDGETVILLKDAVLTEKLTVETNQKWSFGEYTVTIAAVDDNYGLIVKGDLTIDSGIFSVTGIYGIGVTGKLTVNDGTFSVAGSNDYLIGNWGKTVITGGTFQGQYCCVNNFSGTTEIKGGSYSTAAADSADEYPPCDLFADAGMTVTGGTFSKDVTHLCEETSHTVDNGSGRYVYGAHSYETETERQDATCTEDGYVIRVCACGEEHKEILTSQGHIAGTPQVENMKNATVTSAGSYDSVVYCVNCPLEMTRTTIVIPMLLSKIEQTTFTDNTIPETITNSYNTVDELQNTMTDMVVEKYASVLTDAGMAKEDVQTQLQDVVLMYSTDGEEWKKADQQHFPENGRLEIILPVPEGTNHARYTFFVAHMFTTDAFGKTIGDVEYPAVTELVGEDGKEYIKFYVTGLSPVQVAWAETDPCADGHTDADRNHRCDRCDVSMLRGDLDLNGKVNVDDLTLLACHVGQIEFVTDVALQNADVDGNGNVNVDDLTLHAQYVAKIISKWEDGLDVQNSENSDPETP